MTRDAQNRERLAYQHRIDCCIEAIQHYREGAADDKWWCLEIVVDDLRRTVAALRALDQEAPVDPF